MLQTEENHDGRVAVELRRRYDQLKRTLEQTQAEKQKVQTQFAALLKVFTVQRRALEVSISKTKRLEESQVSLAQKNKELTLQNQQATAHGEEVEQELRSLQ